jgi:hypothetical protein
MGGRALLLAAALFSWSGCKSSEILGTRYVSPRVSGRVLDDRTQEPVAGARVYWQRSDLTDRTDEPPRGAEGLKRESGVRADRSGRFILPAQKDLFLLGGGGWYSLNLSFDCTGYARFVTNLTPAAATMTPQGAPAVEVGDIRLRPLSH